MATTMASGTRSTATYRTSGSSAAVPAVKRPLPHPISRYRAVYGESPRQRPRSASGCFSCTAAHRSMRGIRFGFFRIRKGKTPLSRPLRP